MTESMAGSAVEQLRGFARRVRRAARVELRRYRRSRALRRGPRRGRLVYGLFVSLLGLLGMFAWCLNFLSPDAPGRELSQNQLSALITAHRIVVATFQDEDAQVVGLYAGAPVTPVPASNGGATAAPGPSNAANSPSFLRTGESVPSGEGRYHFPYPKSDVLTGEIYGQIQDAGALVSTDKQQTKVVVRMVATFLLPLLILADLFTLLLSLSRGRSSGIGEITSFGTIGRGRDKRAKAALTFDDVAGADEAVVELKEVKDYLTDPERYEEIGAQPPKGVLLFGPPGCGKTLLAKAVAGEAGVPFFSVAGAEFVESLVGVGAARVRDLFDRVRAVAPAIVFIDELDAAGRKRGTGSGGGGSDEREQTLNQLLVEMDGFDVSSGIVVMGATNRPDILDPALMRPGRFDRHITVDQPDLQGRAEILGVHARRRPMAPGVDLTYIARRTPGFTGADLANVINEAALLTVREGKPEIETPELEEAIQRVLSGPKRRGRMLSAEERKRAAYHESGHVIVAAAVGRIDEVHRVSILARARSIGAASVGGEVDAALLTESGAKLTLAGLMGGIAAEMLIFDETSSGGEQDIERATALARDVVGRYGMSGKVGRVRLLEKGADVFLGSEPGLTQLSGLTHQAFDEEVRRLVDDAEARATQLLDRHRDVLDGLARRLESEETIEGQELEAALAGVRPELAGYGDESPAQASPNGRPRRAVKVP